MLLTRFLSDTYAETNSSSLYAQGEFMRIRFMFGKPHHDLITPCLYAMSAKVAICSVISSPTPHCSSTNKLSVKLFVWFFLCECRVTRGRACCWSERRITGWIFFDGSDEIRPGPLLIIKDEMVGALILSAGALMNISACESISSIAVINSWSAARAENSSQGELVRQGEGEGEGGGSIAGRGIDRMVVRREKFYLVL